MSLILDALRKADAERERGGVPSLHAQPVVPSSAAAPAQPHSRSPWVGIAIGLGAGLAGAAIWAFVARTAPPPAAPAPAPAAPSATSMPSVPVATLQTGPAQVPPQVDPRTVAEPAPWPRPDERRAPPPAPAAQATAQVPVLGNVPPGQSALLSREQLPPEIRAQLPALAIGGSIYSPVPSARSLVINGQLFREKDRLTQDLTLEEIRLKSAVFGFRGHRFEVLF